MSALIGFVVLGYFLFCMGLIAYRIATNSWCHDDDPCKRVPISEGIGFVLWMVAIVVSVFVVLPIFVGWVLVG